MSEPLVTVDRIAAARERIAPHVHHTPTLRSTATSERFGCRVHYKAELFQRTGSFKIRGVVHCLAEMEPARLAKGLVSMSAGNHAAALACGAASFGASATIVMPAGAVRSKVDATRAFGGHVVPTDGDLMEEVERLRHERGLTLVHPFDDPRIVAGHGVVGLEIVEDLPEVTHVVVPIGGGGLISGVAAAVRGRCPDVKVIGVEPEGAAAMRRALDAGRPVPVGRPVTIADGLAAPFAGEVNLRHVQALVDDVVTVDEDSIVEALRWIWTRTKLACEPSGAVPLAALIAGKLKPPPTACVCLVVSGGNFDAATIAPLLAPLGDG